MFSTTFANANCFEAVKSELPAVNPYSDEYSITLASSKEYRYSWSFLDEDMFDYTNVFAYESSDKDSILYYIAESKTFGCMGEELVVFDKDSCQILAIGSGYCE